MPRIAEVEKPPAIKMPWLDVWRRALRVMKDQGTWSPALRPLLDEYVAALRSASELREAGAGGVDRDARRALALADALALTPRGRKAANVKTGDADGNEDPFDALDELAEVRAKRAQTA